MRIETGQYLKYSSSFVFSTVYPQYECVTKFSKGFKVTGGEERKDTVICVQLHIECSMFSTTELWAYDI